jgi:hypothetical protein
MLTAFHHHGDEIKRLRGAIFQNATIFILAAVRA